MGNEGSNLPYAYQAVGGLLFLFALVIACVICFKRKSIKIAIEVLQEGSKAIQTLWFLPFYPMWTCVLVIAFTFYSMATIILLLGCGELTFDAESGMRSFDYSDFYENAMWFQIFMFLWMNAFVVDIGKLIVAMAIGMWYWADNPRDKEGKYVEPHERCQDLKAVAAAEMANGADASEARDAVGVPGSALLPDPFTTLLAIQKTMRYHLGSIAMGSFILAVVRFIRLYLLYIQKTSEAYPNNRIVKCAHCIIQCYLACLERCVEFINKNAYIQIGLFGKNFCTAAYCGFLLCMRNCFLIAVLDGITGILILLGKAFIAALTTVICYFMLSSQVASGEISSPIASLLLVFFLAWFIAGAFLQTYDMATDTLVQCVIEDKERVILDSDGRETDFFSDDLRTIFETNDQTPPSSDNQA